MDVRNRSKLEQTLARKLAKQFAQQRRELEKYLGDNPNYNQIPDPFWEDTAKAYLETVEPFLADVYAQQAGALTTDLGVSWTLPNQAAATWASSYAYDLIKDINKNSQAMMQDAIQQYFVDQLTRGDLEDLIARTFGPVRAELIAVTEITRAASAGEDETIQGLKSQGIILEPYWQTNADDLVCDICGPLHQKQTDELPPAHPGCRCWKNYRLTGGQP